MQGSSIWDQPACRLAYVCPYPTSAFSMVSWQMAISKSCLGAPGTAHQVVALTAYLIKFSLKGGKLFSTSGPATISDRGLTWLTCVEGPRRAMTSSARFSSAGEGRLRQSQTPSLRQLATVASLSCLQRIPDNGCEILVRCDY
jgi:hypothetical protein